MNSMPEQHKIYDEFSPKKLILQARTAGFYLLSKWKIILLSALISGTAASIYSYFKKPTYQAEITFALDEGATSNAKNPLSDLSEQLGLESSMDAGGVFSSPGNIVELMQSRLLIEKTIRGSALINSKSIVFADFFLDSLEYRDKWMKKSPYYKINFLSSKKDKKEELFENNIIRNIYELLTTKMIKIQSKGKGTTIISVACVSNNELFSKYFLEAWMAEVTQYYIETKTQRAKINLEFIQKRTDSVKNAYNSALYGRAVFADAHTNPIRQRSFVPGEKQQTDVQILKASYVELVRSLEAAKTILMRDTPLIQYLDIPILPLKKASSSIMKFFLIFFLVGVFLAAGWFFIRKIISHIMKS